MHGGCPVRTRSFTGVDVNDSGLSLSSRFSSFNTDGRLELRSIFLALRHRHHLSYSSPVAYPVRPFFVLGLMALHSPSLSPRIRCCASPCIVHPQRCFLCGRSTPAGPSPGQLFTTCLLICDRMLASVWAKPSKLPFFRFPCEFGWGRCVAPSRVLLHLRKMVGLVRD